MSLTTDIERANRAKQLLDDPMLTEAFESVRTAIHNLWEETPLRDAQGAHELRLMLKLLGDLRAVFEIALADGELAAMKLKEINSHVLSPAQWSGRQ